MTTELIWLLLTAIWTTVLWIPYIVLATRPQNEPHQSFARMPNIQAMTNVAQRAYRAHQNMVEQFAAFAAVVIVAHLAQVSNAVTTSAAMAYFVIRVVHAFGYISGWARLPLRPIIFLLANLCILVIAGAVLLG